MNMPYNKCIITYPTHQVPKVNDTYQHSHFNTLYIRRSKERALIFRALVSTFGGTEALETAVSSYVIPIPFDLWHVQNAEFEINISILNDKSKISC